MRNLMEFNKVKGAPAVPVPLGDYVIPLSGIVNCAPAKCLCLPDIVPAEAFVRAGDALRGVGGSIAASCVRFTPAIGSIAALGVRSRLLFAA